MVIVKGEDQTTTAGERCVEKLEVSEEEMCRKKPFG